MKGMMIAESDAWKAAVSYSASRLLLAFLLLLSLGNVADAQQAKWWSDYGGSPDNSHYFPTTQLTKANVSQLQVAWSYPTHANATYVFNPVVVDNVAYVLSRNSSLVAIDATSGKELWVHEGLTGIAGRGINYWESKDRKDRRLIFQMNNTLQAVDARTGKSILTFGNKGVVNLREGLGRDPKTVYRAQSSNPGKIFENLIILGNANGEGYMSPPGFLRAYDVQTGKLVWTFHTVPQPGQYGYDTWPKDAYKYIGGANTWGEITVDEKRGIAYFPTGSATNDFYGADREGANLFANCLLALDARTGKRLWHYQFVHHDLWDYDATAAPQLLSVTQNGKKIDAVALATKQGFVFAFDRVTGKSLFPIEERPVPQSAMPLEKPWPTQPFPTAPPPFAKQTLTADTVNPYILTPEERAEWKERIAKSRNQGLFTPVTTEETLYNPGNRGGANWGATSANPTDGTLYVASFESPSFMKLRLEPGRPPANAGTHPGQTIYAQNCAACHGADRSGMGGGIPSLQGVVQRLGPDQTREVIKGGRAQMPPFGTLSDAELNDLISYLANPEGAAGDRDLALRAAGAQGNSVPWQGTVAGTGGAPLPDEVKKNSPEGRNPYIGIGGPPYPKDTVAADLVRYYTPYDNNWHISSPPWSTITAYDLNKGTIKWQIPAGVDIRAEAEGAKDTGTMLEPKAVLVTSNGLVFHASRDGKIYAYDADTGKVLWKGDLPGGSAGIPSMYEVNGRAYILVAATAPTPQMGVGQTGVPRGPAAAAAQMIEGAYVAFALPEKPKTEQTGQQGRRQ
ncbi:MAG: PQQ-binding-like beta-propeller repeat protein [Candidatus Korobacteraceae bacterium]